MRWYVGCLATLAALGAAPEVACIVTYYGHMVNPNAPEVDRIRVPVLFKVTMQGAS